MFNLPDTKETILSSSYKYFVVDNKNDVYTKDVHKLKTVRDVYLESLVDVKKSHVLIDNDKRYYFYSPIGFCEFFTLDGKKMPLVFASQLYKKLVSENEDDKVYTRFCGGIH